DGLHDRLDAGAETAFGIAAAPGERHLVADHLAHHVGRAFGDQRRMRDDDDADIAHQRAPSVPPIAGTISALKRAPASTWRIERSPRNEARPRIAFIGLVAAAASSATPTIASADLPEASAAATG